MYSSRVLSGGFYSLQAKGRKWMEDPKNEGSRFPSLVHLARFDLVPQVRPHNSAYRPRRLMYPHVSKYMQLLVWQIYTNITYATQHFTLLISSLYRNMLLHVGKSTSGNFTEILPFLSFHDVLSDLRRSSACKQGRMCKCNCVTGCSQQHPDYCMGDDFQTPTISKHRTLATALRLRQIQLYESSKCWNQCVVTRCHKHNNQNGAT